MSDSKKFPCPHCQKTFGRKDTLLRHMRGHEDNERFTCGPCGFSTNRRDQWTRHLNTRCHELRSVAGSSSDMEPPDIGLPCNATVIEEDRESTSSSTSWKTRSEVYSPVTDVADDDVAEHPTAPSRESSSSPTSWKTRSEVYSPVSDLADDVGKGHICEICGRCFRRLWHLKRHMESVHSRKHRLQCEICMAMFSREDSLRKHMQFRHPHSVERVADRLPCKICDATFARMADLHRHELEQHDPDIEKSYRCPHCKRQFLRRGNLSTHKEFHCPVLRDVFWTQRGGGAAVEPQPGSSNEPQPGPSTEPQPGPSNEPQPRLNDDERRPVETSRFVLVERGFRSRLLTYQLREPLPRLRTIPEVLQDLFEDLLVLLRNALSIHNNIKVNLFLECAFANVHGETTCKRAFKTRNVPITETTDLDEFLREAFDKLIHEKEQCEMVGSGWTYVRVNNLEVRVNKYFPLGERGEAHVPLPGPIMETRGVINVLNTDDRCFAYAMLSKFVPANAHRPESYTPDLFQRYDWTGLEFPVAPKDIKIFEQVNNVSVNVYALDVAYGRGGGPPKYTVFPLKTCRQVRDDHTDLLFVTAEDGRSHYTYISNFSRLVRPQLTQHEQQIYICKRCFAYFTDRPNKLGLTGAQRLEEHRRYCEAETPLRMDLSNSPAIAFKHPEFSRKQRFSIYADFECYLRPADEIPLAVAAEAPHGSSATHIHIPYAFCYHVHDIRGEACRTETYFGEDASTQFMKKLKIDVKRIKDILFNERRLRPQLTPVETQNYNAATLCYLCRRHFTKDDPKVRDHNHAPPYEYRGPAHRSCNLRYREQTIINCYFHNLSNYDAHFVVRELAVEPGDVDVIAHTEERYISFTKRFVFEDSVDGERRRRKGIGMRLRFVDSYRFLSSSLASLAATLPVDQLHETRNAFQEPHLFDLVRRKGVFPYNYVTSYDVLKTTLELPPKEAFYNDLTLEHISDSDYEHARNVWDTFNCIDLEDYAREYLLCDVMLLTDVFEQFRETSIAEYGLDPAHYLTLPSYAWDVMLKTCHVELHTLRDFDMYLFVEQGIRGGISQAITRYAKANHDRCRLEDRRPEEPTQHLMYLDANNLYGWAMSQYLPTGDFTWLTRQEIDTLDILSLDPEGNVGYLLEVDLRYPAHLHDSHKDLPYCCETKRPPTGKFKKLITTLDNKERYICHYRILQQALQNGLELTHVHRALSFRQSRWLETYILKNTELRKKAKTKFEQDYFKLMNNAVFGKTIENVRKRLNVELVCSPDKFQKLVNKSNFLDRTYYGEDVALVHLAKVRIVLEKPIYVGMCVLELSKWLMYDFLKKMKDRYGDRLEVDYMDTDSFIFRIITQDVYRDMLQHLDDFDTSGYPKSNPCYSPANAKVIGKFKDETNGMPLLEYLGLRSKLYFIDVGDDYDETEARDHDGPSPPKKVKTTKKAKGVAKGVVKHVLTPDDYRHCLFHGVLKSTTNTRFQSRLHRVFTVQVEKLSLSPYDEKRFILPDGIHTLPWGHKDIPLYQQQQQQGGDGSEEDEENP